ncbi:MAG: MCE family protein [Phycisphaeraceae bacterium]|nr:MCE family protein [Phycisphaeraceae bacterium]
MKPIVRDFMVGLTALLGVGGLLFALMFFGELTFERQYEFRVRLANANGLQQSSRVTMNGVSIGQIRKTAVLPPDIGGVELTVSVKRGIDIPRLAEISVERGLIGDASLDFVIPAFLSVEQRADAVREGDVFEGGSPTTMFDRIAKTVEGPLSKLSDTVDKFDRLVEVYTNVGERIAAELEPRTQADLDAGQRPNLFTAIEKLDVALASANTWLTDEDLRASVKQTITDAQTMLNDASEAARQIKASAESADRTLADVGEGVADARRRIETLGDQAAGLLAQAEQAAGTLHQLLDETSKGRGTVGQLMKNPDLYNSLHDATRRLEKTLVEVQLLIEQYKAEGIKLRL